MIKITPSLLLLPLRLGGATKSIPLPITMKKQLTFAVKFVIKLIRNKNRAIKVKSIADVLISAIYGKGLAMEKKQAIHEIASVNRHLIRFFK